MSTTADVTAESLRAVPHGIVIVGGGWAGLAAAVELARHGRKPVVLEAARTLGGRARSLRAGARVLNNGQHLLLGAYRSVLAMLEVMNIPEDRVLRRLPLGVGFRSTLGGEFRLQTRALPAPLHLLWALAMASGLSVEARRAALRLLWRARRDRFDVRPDVTLTYYLRRCAQPAETIRTLWQPLCQAALATPIERASTRLFLHVLRDVFFGRRMRSDLLVPVEPLLDCLPKPAAEFVEAHGGSVRVGVRVQALHVDDDGMAGVQTREQSLPARHVILATQPDAAAALLREHPPAAKLARQLERLELHQVSTLHLEYPADIGLPQALVGVLDGTVQWLFDHGRAGGQPGRLTAMLAGPGAHEQLSNQALTALMRADIARLFPEWPAPLGAQLIREKRAVLAATPENEIHRPRSLTPVQGLWLAGDYTVAGYPSSLEAAVRSGVIAARRVLREQQRQGDT